MYQEITFPKRRRNTRAEAKAKRFEYIRWLRLMRNKNLTDEDLKDKSHSLSISQLLHYHLRRMKLISYDNSIYKVNFDGYTDEKIYQMLSQEEKGYNKKAREERRNAKEISKNNSNTDEIKLITEKLDKILNYLNIK